jgi:nitrite reductase/ring-hydroxylating ferredoxin subunit
VRRISRYVEDLLRGRRPRRFVPTDDESDALRAAIELRGARPESAIPRPEFLTALRGRLAEQAALAGEGEPEPVRVPARRRRIVLAGAGVAAASAVVAVTVDRVVGVGAAATASGTLTPSDGDWLRVLASADLAEGGAQTFDTGTVTGYLTRTGGTVEARSGICTHQGCRLKLNVPERRLDCPCHRTFFALDGTVVRSQLPTPPARLPDIAVRERNGEIQVFVPKQ